MPAEERWVEVVLEERRVEAAPVQAQEEQAALEERWVAAASPAFQCQLQ